MLIQVPIVGSKVSLPVPPSSSLSTPDIAQDNLAFAWRHWVLHKPFFQLPCDKEFGIIPEVPHRSCSPESF